MVTSAVPVCFFWVARPSACACVRVSVVLVWSSLEVARGSCRGLLPCQFLVSLQVDGSSGGFVESGWLPRPAAFVAMAAAHFRELVTTVTTTATATHSVVQLRIVPSALIPHGLEQTHSSLRYTVNQRSGELSPITADQHRRENEQGEGADEDDGSTASGGLSAVQWVSQCFSDKTAAVQDEAQRW